MIILNKIKAILLSRIKNNTEEEWIEARREICLRCDYNTLNIGSLKGYNFFLATTSKFLSKIMGKGKKDGSIGFCSICGCDNYYKTLVEEENCSANPPKWEAYNKNSIRLNIRQNRKNESNKNNRK